MGVNDRILTLIKHFNLNPNSFADSIGVKGTVIYNIIKGRKSKPSFDLLQKILITYHTINANWLLNGDGKIVRDLPKEISKPIAVKLEGRISSLLSEIEKEEKYSHISAELGELITTIVQENVEQKAKIKALYKKQEEILNVIRVKLNLDF